jgi:hypothetical protein
MRHIQVYVNEETLSLFKVRTKQLNKNLSAYLRDLAMADCLEAVKQEPPRKPTELKYTAAEKRMLLGGEMWHSPSLHLYPVKFNGMVYETPAEWPYHTATNGADGKYAGTWISSTLHGPIAGDTDDKFYAKPPIKPISPPTAGSPVNEELEAALRDAFKTD